MISGIVMNCLDYHGLELLLSELTIKILITLRNNNIWCFLRYILLEVYVLEDGFDLHHADIPILVLVDHFESSLQNLLIQL